MKDTTATEANKKNMKAGAEKPETPESKRKPRPAQQIYRPPGVGSGASPRTSKEKSDTISETPSTTVNGKVSPKPKSPPSKTEASNAPSIKDKNTKDHHQNAPKPSPVAGKKQPANNQNNNNSTQMGRHNEKNINNGASTHQQKTFNNQAQVNSAKTNGNKPKTPTASRRSNHNQQNNSNQTNGNHAMNANQEHRLTPNHNNNNHQSQGGNANRSLPQQNNRPLSAPFPIHNGHGGPPQNNNSRFSFHNPNTPPGSQLYQNQNGFNNHHQQFNHINHANNFSNNPKQQFFQQTGRAKSQTAIELRPNQNQMLANANNQFFNNAKNGSTWQPNVNAPKFESSFQNGNATVVQMRQNNSSNGQLTRNTAQRKSLILNGNFPVAPQASSTTKDLSEKELNELKATLKDTKLNEQWEMRMFMESNFKMDDQGRVAAKQLIEHVTSKELTVAQQKSLSKATAQLVDSNLMFHKSVISSMQKVVGDAESLRTDNSTNWLRFLNYTLDLYSTLGMSYEGDLTEVVFKLFELLLQKSTVETLKIEELEYLISALLAIGYDLERQSPSQLAQLRDTIRDAELVAHEPWARKMILLLVELCASGWKLPSQANEYYFQTSVHGTDN